MRLRNKNFTPVGGWRWEHPETKYKFIASSREDLKRQVEEYGRENLVWVPKWSSIEDWLCQAQDLSEAERKGMQEHQCCESESDLKRSMGTYLKGAVSLVKGIGRYVPQEEAEKRAKICANCPNNVRPRGFDAVRNFTDLLAEAVLFNKKTSVDAELFNCDICTCNMRVKVHYEQGIVTGSLGKKEYDVLLKPILGLDGKDFKCWQVYTLG